MIELKDYQQKIVDEGFEKLKKHNFLYIAAEMRTGKTLMSLSILNLDPSVNNVLFVTVKKAIPSINKDYSLLNPNFKISVINYESVQRYKDEVFDAVVFDEAQSLGAFPKPSNKTVECFKILKKCRDHYVIFLSGTPSIESSSQLFHQLFMVSSHPFREFKNFYAWHKEWGIHNMIRGAGGMPRVDYSLTKDFIKEYLEPASVTITKKDANFNHYEPMIECVSVPLSTSTMEIYNSIKQKGLYIKESDEVIADSAVKVVGKLSQVTGGSVITEAGNLLFTSLAKVKAVQTIREQYESIVIFYKYQGDRELLKSHLGKYTEDPEEWRQNLSTPLLLQVKSGSRGVDLSQADIQVYYSLDFSGEAFVQGIDRQAHMNRTKPYVIKILIAVDENHKPLIDSYIFNAVSSKKDFNVALYKKLS